MPRYPRKIVEKKTYYYASESESESESENNDGHVARYVFPDGDESWIEELTDDESDSDASDYDPARDSESEEEEEEAETDEEEVSDSEDGTDYESETESESDSEELDDPKPYYGKGFRVYFDSSADKKFFMRAFGFSNA